MKVKKIPFNIRYEQDVANGKYNVVCGDDCVPVRVICWDADERYPIVCIDNGIAYQYTENGICSEESCKEDDSFRLYLVPTRTEFNEALRTFYENSRSFDNVGNDAINAAADILYETAREQLFEELGLSSYSILEAKELIEHNLKYLTINPRNGVTYIANERVRQIVDEGYSEAADEHYVNEELAKAAATYATPANYRLYEATDEVPSTFPWDKIHWKPTPNDRIRELSKAGALCAAEIDRLLKLVENESNNN